MVVKNMIPKSSMLRLHGIFRRIEEFKIVSSNRVERITMLEANGEY
jgi:hypothetical protein